MREPLRRLVDAVSHGDGRARVAERLAGELRERLPDDHVVLARYAPRDGGDRVDIVVVGRDRLFVVEARDEDGEFVCYQDHWYRQDGPSLAHPITDAPSLRARANADRVRSDLGTGGFLNVAIEPLVLLVRGRAQDVRSSCVAVLSGVDALVGHVLHGEAAAAAPERTHALASALAHRITLATT